MYERIDAGERVRQRMSGAQHRIFNRQAGKASAELHFAAEDWRAADAGFAGHADPIAGMQERNFHELFTRLVNLAPAPVGLGEPWKRTA